MVHWSILLFSMPPLEHIAFATHEFDALSYVIPLGQDFPKGSQHTSRFPSNEPDDGQVGLA